MTCEHRTQAVGKGLQLLRPRKLRDESLRIDVQPPLHLTRAQVQVLHALDIYFMKFIICYIQSVRTYQAALESLGDEVLVAPHMAQTVVGLRFEVQWALGRIHLRVLLLLIHHTTGR
jgi:hypothetical protein